MSGTAPVNLDRDHQGRWLPVNHFEVLPARTWRQRLLTPALIVGSACITMGLLFLICRALQYGRSVIQ